jgi:hypothetical protein
MFDRIDRVELQQELHVFTGDHPRIGILNEDLVSDPTLVIWRNDGTAVFVLSLAGVDWDEARISVLHDDLVNRITF